MTDLERRALLGDRQAQEECTRLGIVLPCPKCGKNVQEYETVAELCCLEPGSDGYDILEKYVGIVCNTVQGGCGIFVCGEKENDKKSALFEWNTRPAPPIGRCGVCLHYEMGVCLKIYDDGSADSDAWQHRSPEDFCSYFEPKDGEEQ